MAEDSKDVVTGESITLSFGSKAFGSLELGILHERDRDYPYASLAVGFQGAFAFGLPASLSYQEIKGVPGVNTVDKFEGISLGAQTYAGAVGGMITDLYGNPIA